MNEMLRKALSSVEMSYEDLIEIAKDTVVPLTQEVDSIISAVYDNVNNLSNDSLRDILLRLSLRSYSFSETKEVAQFKMAIAENVKKVAFSTAFNSSEGSVAVRENTSIINTANEAIVDEIYTYIASLLKTKTDEIHRCVDTMKTVLMSRLSEAKLVNMGNLGVTE